MRFVYSYKELLVLCNITVFSKFRKFIYIVTFLITFETSNIIQVFKDFVIANSTIISYIDISNQSTKILSLLETILPFFFSLRFFIRSFVNLPKLCNGLIIIVIERLIFLVLGFKRFFRPIVLKEQAWRSYSSL